MPDTDPSTPVPETSAHRQETAVPDLTDTQTAERDRTYCTDPEEYQLSDDELRNVASTPGRWTRPLAREVLALRARVAELEAQAERVRAVHQPIEALNMRHHPRGQIARVCSGCGTDDGNWQLYPCPTIRALDRAGDVPTYPRTAGGGR